MINVRLPSLLLYQAYLAQTQTCFVYQDLLPKIRALQQDPRFQMLISEQELEELIQSEPLEPQEAEFLDELIDEIQLLVVKPLDITPFHVLTVSDLECSPEDLYRSLHRAPANRPRLVPLSSPRSHEEVIISPTISVPTDTFVGYFVRLITTLALIYYLVKSNSKYVDLPGSPEPNTKDDLTPFVPDAFAGTPHTPLAPSPAHSSNPDRPPRNKISPSEHLNDPSVPMARHSRHPHPQNFPSHRPTGGIQQWRDPVLTLQPVGDRSNTSTFFATAQPVNPTLDFAQRGDRSLRAAIVAENPELRPTTLVSDASQSIERPSEPSEATAIATLPSSLGAPAPAPPVTSGSESEPLPDESGDRASPSSLFSSGFLTVGTTGLIGVDFLYDGGAYQGELGVFSISGLEHYAIGSSEWMQEIIRRVLSHSPLGHIVISDITDGARWDINLPWETTFNSGDYRGIQTVSMRPGDQVGFALIPHSTFASAANNPGVLPLLSLRTNPLFPGFEGNQFVYSPQQNIWMIEDASSTIGDRDFNDVIFQITGATGSANLIQQVIHPTRNWLNLALGQALFPIKPAEVLAAAPSTSVSSVNASLLQNHPQTTPFGYDVGSVQVMPSSLENHDRGSPISTPLANGKTTGNDAPPFPSYNLPNYYNSPFVSPTIHPNIQPNAKLF